MNDDVLTLGGYSPLIPSWGTVPLAKPRERMGFVHRSSQGQERHRANVIAKRRAARKNAKEARRG